MRFVVLSIKVDVGLHILVDVSVFMIYALCFAIHVHRPLPIRASAHTRENLDLVSDGIAGNKDTVSFLKYSEDV